MPADPKPEGRVKDPELLRRLHRRWRECALCGDSRARLSLHHVHRHPRDDVTANLIMLCGDGTRGCHGRVEHHDPATMRDLGRVLVATRPEFLTYLTAKLGGRVEAAAWMNRYLYADV